MLGLYLLLALILLARSENVQAAVAEAISQVDSFIVMAVYQLGDEPTVVMFGLLPGEQPN
jgi:hypothetical protein